MKTKHNLYLWNICVWYLIILFYLYKRFVISLVCLNITTQILCLAELYRVSFRTLYSNEIQNGQSGWLFKQFDLLYLKQTWTFKLCLPL